MTSIWWRRCVCYPQTIMGFIFKTSACRTFPNLTRLFSTIGVNEKPLKTKYDAIIIGSGHNGLVSASYLQKNGFNVCVLERRPVIGGAAVTEEIVPGFKFSRASYLLSLLRPQVYKDLELKKYGLKVYLRNPNAYTPLLEPALIKGQKVSSLTLGRDQQKNKEQIAQFSSKDSEQYHRFEAMLDRIVSCLDPLLDNQPVHLPNIIAGMSVKEKMDLIPMYWSIWKAFSNLQEEFPTFIDLLTAPASQILNKWFESEPLKATLATDAVIGAMISPDTPGSGYVLLHHVMGEIEGVKGAWGYVEGGMGAVSQAIANCALDHGASIFTDKAVKQIITDKDEIRGVELIDGTEINAKIVLSNATPKITFLDLLPTGILSEKLEEDLRQVNYESPVTKINVAVSRIPNFVADPNRNETEPMPHHQCTIHLNSENIDLINSAYLSAKQGIYSQRPMIEMTIPSSLDPTLAPPGGHVVLLFTQYTPYHLNGEPWTNETKNQYADTVFDCIEKYAPGFKDSVIGRDILTPPDLEQVFGLTGGNIFHGSMSLNQLYMCRPSSELSHYTTPVKGLYLCGSGAHPGGGVMGAPGRLAALQVIEDRKRFGL